MDQQSLAITIKEYKKYNTRVAQAQELSVKNATFLWIICPVLFVPLYHLLVWLSSQIAIHLPRCLESLYWPSKTRTISINGMDYTTKRNASLTPWITMGPIKQENWPSNIKQLACTTHVIIIIAETLHCQWHHKRSCLSRPARDNFQPYPRLTARWWIRPFIRAYYNTLKKECFHNAI